jgi:hypothetical protein
MNHSVCGLCTTLQLTAPTWYFNFVKIFRGGYATIRSCYYPEDQVFRVQALSQDERHDERVCLRVSWLWLLSPDSGELRSRHVPRGPVSCLLAHGSFRAVICLMTLAPTTRPRGSSGTATCPLGSSSHLLAQGSFGAATCLMGGLYGP